MAKMLAPKVLAVVAALALLPVAAPVRAGPPGPSLFFPSAFPFPQPFPGPQPFPDPFPNPIPVFNPPPHRDPLPPLPWPIPGPAPGSFHGAPAPLLAAGIPAFLALGAGGVLARLLRRRHLRTATDTLAGADGTGA